MASLKSSLQRANKEIEELKSRIEELEQTNKDLRKKANDNFLKPRPPELKDDEDVMTLLLRLAIPQRTQIRKRQRSVTAAVSRFNYKRQQLYGINYIRMLS
jgi:chromosome segregation ATPase